MSIIHLENGEWTYSNSDGFLHGQHIKMYGSCGYVHYRLITKVEIDIRNKIRNKIKEDKKDG